MFRASRAIVSKLLRFLFAERLFGGTFSFLFRSRSLGRTLYDSLVDTVTVAFWIGLVLIIAEVAFGNLGVFAFLDNHRWLGLLFPAGWVYRILSKKRLV